MELRSGHFHIAEIGKQNNNRRTTAADLNKAVHFVSRPEDKKVGHANSDTMHVLLWYMEITRKSVGINIST